MLRAGRAAARREDRPRHPKGGIRSRRNAGDADHPFREANTLGDGGMAVAAIRDISIRVRSARPTRAATPRPISEAEAEVELLSAEEGVAPGQSCAFHDAAGSRVLGGGWIWRGN